MARLRLRMDVEGSRFIHTRNIEQRYSHGLIFRGGRI